MRRLSSSDLLTVWESAFVHGPQLRALELLAAACPETPREELERLPIGRRDARLLDLRVQTFGPDFRAVARCPDCGEIVESNFSASDIRLQEPAVAAPEFEISFEEYRVWVRLPNTRDVVDLAGHDVAFARRRLIESCVLRVERAAERITAGQLPAAVAAALSSALAENDPQADVRLDLTCPSCRSAWVEVFDIVSFFWTEIQSRVTRLLQEVHTLARSFGWSERDILSMTDTRRRIYLAMVGG